MNWRGIVGYDPEEEYGIFTDQGIKYGAYVFGEVPVGRECEMTVNIKKSRRQSGAVYVGSHDSDFSLFPV